MGKTYRRSRKEYFDYEEGYDTRSRDATKKDKAARAAERARKQDTQDKLYDGADDSYNSPVQAKKPFRKDNHR